MKIAAALVFLLSFSAFAGAAWQDLAIGENLAVAQNLALDAKPSGTISIRKGSPYTLDSIAPLDGLDVVDYVFTTRNCRRPDLEGVLTMVLPAGNSPASKAEVGVYFLKGCALEVMVEAKDLGKPSLFLRVR